MEMTVFRTKVQRAVSEALGEEYSVELREVQKNNGVILQGLMIRRAQENMMPTLSGRLLRCTEKMPWENRSISHFSRILKK